MENGWIPSPGSPSNSKQVDIPPLYSPLLRRMEVRTLEKLTQKALNLKTKPHTGQGQVIELKTGVLYKKLYAEPQKP